MHRHVFAAVLASTTAHADAALSVNPPFRWADGGAIAASGYYGVTEHHAIRANFARYDYGPNAAGELIGILAYDSDGSEGYYGGTITDVGIGWMISPERLADGFSLELGFLVRKRDAVFVEDSFAREYRVETESETVAGRLLIGWSWRFGAAFLSVQAGIAGGYEVGRERVQEHELDTMTTTRDVARQDVSAEGFMRIGAVFQ